MKPDQAYEKLSEHGKQLAYLSSAVAILDWDQRTQIPPKGNSYRVEAVSGSRRDASQNDHRSHSGRMSGLD